MAAGNTPDASRAGSAAGEAAWPLSAPFSPYLPMKSEDMPLLCWFLGALLFVGGVALFSPRGAFIAAGLVLLRTAAQLVSR